MATPRPRWPTGKVEEAEWALGLPCHGGRRPLASPAGLGAGAGSCCGGAGEVATAAGTTAASVPASPSVPSTSASAPSGSIRAQASFARNSRTTSCLLSRPRLTFYLVAKTEEEMQVWVHSISQVCNLSHLEDSTSKSQLGVGGWGAEARCWPQVWGWGELGGWPRLRRA